MPRPTIKKRADFQTVLNKGTKVHCKHFVLFFMPSDKFSYGIIASKKSVGNSVQRNLAKRRVHELIRELSIYSQPFAVVVICRKAMILDDFSSIKQHFKKLL